MPRKKTPLFQQYKKRFLRWLLPITGIKALLIFILVPIVGWILLDGFITIRNSIELNNEIKLDQVAA